MSSDVGILLTSITSHISFLSRCKNMLRGGGVRQQHVPNVHEQCDMSHLFTVDCTLIFEEAASCGVGGSEVLITWQISALRGHRCYNATSHARRLSLAERLACIRK